MIDPKFLKTVNVDAQENARLEDWTTFRLGGPCSCLIACQTPEQLQTVVARLYRDKTPFLLIGGGSNLVVSDDGVPCAVIRYASDTPLIEQDGCDLHVSGSTPLDSLAQYAADRGLGGINYASGIPGTVGGAIAGNAGAFGQQVGDCLKIVTLLSPDGGVRCIPPKELDFTYRHSRLKETGDIVASAKFLLRPGDRDALLREREEILKIRREKHPDLKIHPCAGSFFRNIEPTSKAEKRQAAGWFLEQAGAKNMSCGGAVIFAKHANIIVKSDGCTAKDIYELSRAMAASVKQKFGFDLVREVRFVGRFEGVPESEKNLVW